ncbi:MAG: ATP-binding cassette domain-containing protein, partial [Pirellulales bacterium]
VPFDQLNAKQRRVVFHGTGDQWIDVYAEGRRKKTERPLFRFQFKGLYPALEEAARLSPALRSKWEHLVGEVECSTCGGSRLRDDAAAVRLRGRTIDDLCRVPLEELAEHFDNWSPDERERKIAGELVREVSNRLRFLVDVGLEYLTLGRPAPTLSGGEAQRIRLASQVGSGLCGVLYVLDEPTIGLHPRDNRRLLAALAKLRDLGNTLLVVEHDRDVVAAADQLLDFGPAAGESGGQIVARGTPEQVARNKDSVTGPYLSGKKAIAVPTNRRMPSVMEWAKGNGAKKGEGKKARGTKHKNSSPLTLPSPASGERALPEAPGGWLEIVGARHNNLRNMTAHVPLGCFSVVTGVSGSGKSSLVEDVLYGALARTLHRASTTPGQHDAIRGVEQINKVIRVDQQSLGQTPTSNPATYTGVFELIRALYAQLPEARVRGYTSRRFSFNVPGGRCEECEGNGQKCIEMHFLPDVWVECDTCRGRRYNPETLAVTYHGQSIADVLDMSCGRAVKLFENIPKIRRILQTLCDVGLDYLTLGQAAPTLSGGEAQRVKLAAELARPDTGRTLYLLDEPTTGLHFEDIAKLLDVLNRLVDLGNSVLVIEHNLDVIKTADWVIDLGPEAGDGGGHVVTSGTPEDVAAYAALAAGGNGWLRSHTGEVLAAALQRSPRRKRAVFDFAAEQSEQPGDVDIADVGKDSRMPWEVDGRRWHTRDRVGRKGQPCRWDGRILERIVDRIGESDQFGPTNWNARTIVEISSPNKSEGWFLHAITGEEWLLKLKFRVAKNTFKREDLIAELKLRPLDELAELPVYGHEPRVKCKNLRGPFQEVQLQVHSLEEVDKPAFWRFLDSAIAGYDKFISRVRQKPEDIMPWKVLGQKWHFARKGFPPGKPPKWDVEVLEELCEMIKEAAPDGQFLWNNQQLVHVFVKGQHEPWATIVTKRVASVDLALNGPKGRFALGRVKDLGADREFQSGPDRDTVRFRFTSTDDLDRGDLSEFLAEHLASLSDRKQQVAGASV